MDKCRPFLKWPGGKFRLIDTLHQVLPKGRKLIEPFVGGAALFLNSDYERYVLNDINPHLIELYQILQTEGPDFIDCAQAYFKPQYNTHNQYYHLRAQFNQETDKRRRAALFLYLNRHGYNGLCRYNLQGAYNVPFGRYLKPYFPRKEMLFFHQKAQHAIFNCQSFEQSLKHLRAGQVVYCDPPYLPLNTTANFTQYQVGHFGLAEQRHLAYLARQLQHRGVRVLISNHYTALSAELYQGAQLRTVKVRRFISCKVSARTRALEVLALY